MITNNEVNLYIEYDKFGMERRYIPKTLKSFSDSSEFVLLYDLYGRLLLEKNTKVSTSYSNETKNILEQEFDSPESISLFIEFVHTDDQEPSKSNPWWKFW